MEDVFTAEEVLLVAVLLLVAGAAVMVASRLRVQTAVGLALAGLALGGLARIEGLVSMAESELTPGVTLFVFLPSLLFESAFNIDARRLGENLLPVVILALPVLVVSAAIVGLIVTVGLGMSLGVALVFGALISATDPVAVLSIFREVGAPKRLALMGDSTRHASIRTDTDMETLTIKEDVFRNLLESLPRIATRIAQARSYYVDRGPPLTRDAPGDA